MHKYKNVWVILSLACLKLLFFIPLSSEAQSATSEPDETCFALLVDVSEYKDSGIPPLKSKGRGMDEIRDSLRSTGGYPDKQMYLVSLEKATREGIIESLTMAINRIKAQENARFFFYLRGRYIKMQNESYLLPYDARIGATSTYIRMSELSNIWDKIALTKGTKAYIWATWDLSYQGEEDFTSQLAGILANERTDADGDRNITFNEIDNRRKQISIRASEPQVFTNINTNTEASLIRLPSVLEVNSQPSGAIVLIDNMDKGVTPARIMGLAQGEHRLSVKKELYRQSEERIFSLNSTRGQKINIATFQLIPIRISGSVLDSNQNPVTYAEVWIDGTEHRQKVGDDGRFVFDNKGLLDSLELGKPYSVIVRSLDGMFSGKASFIFKGMEDISLNIPVVQKDWLGLAQERFAQNDNKGVLEVLDGMLRMPGAINEDRFRSIPKPLVSLFIDGLKKRIESEPDNLKFQYTLAILSDIVGDPDSAKKHWEKVKKVAPRESDEYSRAVARIKQLSLIKQPWVVAIIYIGVFVFLAGLGFGVRELVKWARFRKFRDIPNPYIAGKPISEPKMFFGREDIFSFIKDKFSRDTKDITIVLHGGRRTGKTSILYQIANGRLGQDFVPVFIDMQEMAGVDAHDFFRSIAQKVSQIHKASVDAPGNDRVELEELLKNLEDKSKSAYQSFNKYITAVASMLKDKHLIFLIDEYEILERKVNDGDLSDEIFTYLRHLMQNINNLAFIFSGSQEFGHRKRKEWSLMFNMAQSKEVSFLSYENAIALITKPVKDYVRYDNKSIERILRLTAAHPYFTQALCQQIIEELNEKQQNKVNIEQVQLACRDIVENAPFHLSFVWGELSNDEKILIAIMSEIIQDGMSYISPDDIMSKMPTYQLKYDLAAINKTLAQLMEEHLVEKKPQSELYRFQMDLIREWIRVEHPIWGVLREVSKNE